MRRNAPGVSLDWNVGASGADPDADAGGSWDPASWPGNDYVDIVGRDYYCRSQGRDIDHVRGELEEHAAWARAHGKPVSYPEVGITLPNPGTSGTATGGDDSTCAAFIQTVLGFANRADLAYFVWWGATRTDQGYRYRPTEADTRTWTVLTSFYR